MRNPARNAYVFALTCFILLSLFLYRGIFSEGIIACDDLSPFFSWNQLEQYHFSSWFEALQGVPYRAKYSFMLSWTRFMPFIKSSMVIVVAVSGFLIFSSNALTLQMVFENRLKKNEKLFASLASSIFTLFILLYSKLVHYYTFILGTGMTFLAWSFFVKSLKENEPKESILPLLLAAFLLHLVPSIQLVFISYFFFLFSSILSVLFFHSRVRKVLLSMITIFVGHLIPYTLYLFCSFGTENVSLTFGSVAVSYSRVRSNSINPLLFLTFPHSSTLNKYLLGSYVLDFYPSFLIPTAICFLTFFKLRKNNLVKILSVLYLISFFFAVGFESQFSAYQFIADLPSYFSPLRFFSSAFLQILRYPHRWACIVLYVQALLLSCFAIVSYKWLSKSFSNTKFLVLLSKKSIVYSMLLLIIISPFLAPPFTSIFTGDFGGALKPFTSYEMEKIKDTLQNSQSEAKVISFPRMDYRTVRINDNIFLFTDEFYNLFFEVPAIEGVSGTPIQNRFYVSLGHYLLYNNRTNVGRYFSLLGSKYIFFHNDTTEDRMINETRNVLSSLKTQSDISLVFEEGQYYLFEVDNTGICTPLGAMSKSLILFYGPYWVPWRFLSEYGISPYNATVAELVSGEITWSFFASASEELGDRMVLYVPKEYFNEKDVVLSLLLMEEGTYLKPDLLDSIKLGKNGWKTPDDYFTLSIFGTTNDSFVFSQEENSTINFTFDVQEPNEYSVFIKIHTPDNASLTCQLDDKTYTLVANETLTYRYLQVYEGRLEKGAHTISLRKMDANPLFFDLVYIIEKNRLDSHITEFGRLTEEEVFTSEEYSEACRHISQLEYPENFSIIYYCGDLYSPNMIVRSSNDTFKPMRAWYAGSFILVPEQRDIGDFEVLHLPTSDSIKAVTLCYSLYLILFAIGLAFAKKTSVLSSLISRFNNLTQNK